MRVRRHRLAPALARGCRSAALAGLAVAGVLLGGCGAAADSASAPAAPSSVTPARLVAQSLQAFDRQHAVHLALSTSVAARVADPQVQAYLRTPVRLRLSGDFSDTAANLAGSVRLRGKPYAFAVTSDEQRSFVELMGVWYGPTDALLDQQTTSDAAELREALEAVRRYGDQVVTGRVTAGPEVDGVATWRFAGTPNATGIVRAAQRQGQPLDADEQSALRALAPLVKLTLVVGREDHLPRRLGVAVDLSPAQLAVLNRIGDEGGSADELRALHVHLDLALSKWGETVSSRAPRSPQPIDALGGALLGLLMAAGQR
jgi:hypothetical protein